MPNTQYPQHEARSAVHSLSRRTFVAATVATATSAALAVTWPRRLQGQPRPAGLASSARSVGQRSALAVPPGPLLTLCDPQIKVLALSAVDAAKSAGASYADVRLTYIREREVGDTTKEGITLGLSVRALAEGAWGWAATPYLAASEAPRVAQAAVALAKANAITRAGARVEWAPRSAVEGTWATPVTQDPFAVPLAQVQDWVHGLRAYITDLAPVRGEDAPFGAPGYWVAVSFRQQERVFASTEGSYCTQTVTITEPYVKHKYRWDEVALPFRAAQQGYEVITETSWRELVRQGMDRIDATHPLPSRPLEIGRYDVVLNATAMAALLAQTLGTAAQVDRALGYEANAGGTSYLGPDPLTQLGNVVAAPLVSVTADRTDSKGVATCRWDDEGVSTTVFPLVKDGVLVDYQTTREQGAWLAPWYQQHGQSVPAHGCAAAADALALPLQHTPNLTLEPGKGHIGLEELVSSLEHGLVVEDKQGGLSVRMDFQVLNGLAIPAKLTEVRHGKRVATIQGAAGFLLRTPEFWKRVQALGGPASLERLFRGVSVKGEPEQRVAYSVAAVPVLVNDQALIDYSRKA